MKPLIRGILHPNNHFDFRVNDYETNVNNFIENKYDYFVEILYICHSYNFAIKIPNMNR